MAGNAGKGRAAGTKNRRTQALLDLAEDGEAPVAYALRVMRDDDQPADLRMHAAKLAAPFIHPRPLPPPRLVAFDIPGQLQTGNLVQAHEALLRATAAGDIAVDDARDISSMLDAHRRIIEAEQLEERIAALEKAAR